MKLLKFTKILIIMIFTSNLLFSYCSENSNANNNLNQNFSQENLKDGIYLNEKMEKHRKARLAFEYTSKNHNSNLNKAANRKNVLSNQENPLLQGGFSPDTIQKNQAVNPQKNVELQKSGPIVHEGWVKYFKFTNEALTDLTPKEFIKNPAFYEQRKFYPKADFSKANTNGVHEFIRNENYFYLSIFPGYLVFNQSKKVKILYF